MIIIGVDYHPSDQRPIANVHLALRRQRNVAKVATARRLAVRMYWMWRNSWKYSEWVKFGSHAGQLGTGSQEGV